MIGDTTRDVLAVVDVFHCCFGLFWMLWVLLLLRKPQTPLADGGTHCSHFLEILLDAQNRCLFYPQKGDVVPGIPKGIRDLDRDQFEADESICQKEQKDLGRPNARKRAVQQDQGHTKNPDHQKGSSHLDQRKRERGGCHSEQMCIARGIFLEFVDEVNPLEQLEPQPGGTIEMQSQRLDESKRILNNFFSFKGLAIGNHLLHWRHF
mmetsp:Transcript_5505/g.11378  ORF Transcript_5505/g.11378 Transcript_5505/m.11378 type:complete len:207 (+) Transcript_5505:475-1095(+)